jgi:N-acetylneuraminic acid mutarotase
MLSRRLLIIGLLLASAYPVARAQTAWEPLAPFPGPTREIALVAAAGKIYAFAGQGNAYTPLGLVYEYDPASNSWTKKKNMPLPAHHVAMAEYNGKIYGFGGFKKPDSGQVSWEAINNSWMYDPATDVWKALKPMPSLRGAASAAVVDGKIYVLGGAGVHPNMKNVPLVLGPDGTPNRSLDTVEEYDVASDSWRVRNTMPTPRNHFAVSAVNGKIYAIGGRMGSTFGPFGSDTDVVEEYDPAHDSWGLEKARMTTPRGSMSWDVYNGRVYVVGGSMTDARVTASFRTTEAYDPVKNQWFGLVAVPMGRAPDSGAVIGDKFYLLSEYNGYQNLTGERKPSDGSPFDVLSLKNLQ